MNPKEKALELLEKMGLVQKPSLRISSNEFNINDTKENAKLCALILVDEMIEFSTNKCCEFQNRKYWEEVKLELEKL